VAIGGKGTMLIHPSNLRQFGQGVNEKPTSLSSKLFEGFYETNEGTQNKLQTTPK
jgi:hypothetical protein